MGLKYSSAESIQITKAMHHNLSQVLATVDSLRSATQRLTGTIGTEGMQGATYEAGRKLFTSYIAPLVNSLEMIAEELQADLQSYSSADSEVSHYGKLDEDLLKETIQRCDNLLNHLNHSKISSTLPTAVALRAVVEETKRKAKKRLMALINFNSAISGLFTMSGSLGNLGMAMGALGGISIGASGLNLAPQAKAKFGYIINELISNVTNHEARRLQRRYHLSDEQTDALRGELPPQIKIFQQDGWSMKAIVKGYLRQMKLNPADEIQTQVANYFKLARTFGSKPFKSMWQIDSNKANRSEAKILLRIAMNYTKMPNELKVDDAKLINNIDRHLSPADKLWTSFAKVVQTAFPGDSMANSKSMLAKQVHQFRYVISAQQAQWVRDNYRKSGMTDEQALAKYLATELEEGQGIGKYTLKESARLHNKGRKINGDRLVRMEYPGKSKANFKVVSNFHTEFIIDSKGNFLNELDPEWNKNTKENGIINGASFNYASKNDSVHQALDVNTVKPDDPSYRNDFARGYNSPKNSSTDEKGYKNNSEYAEYSINRESAYDRVQSQLTAFKEKIEVYKNK